MRRVETAGAKTWLLGALALWALGVWVFALFGMGGKVAPLEDDPALAGSLPKPAAAPAERLGPLPQYAAMGERPLFTDDRRPQPFLINPAGEGEAQVNAFDYVLTSVLRTPNFQMAILQTPDGSGEPMRVKVGDAPKAAPGWHLASVDARSAVFNGPEGERKLELRVFNGNGGEPPTAISVSGTVPPAAQPVPGQPVPPPIPNQVPPKPQNGEAPPPQPAPAEAAAQDAATQQQIEAIRKRIEARRAKLRQEAQQQQQQPSPPPGQTP
ncbi:general secretion pathway protein GspN [Luteimonas aquatica]|uniref:general secretion pathway protein GspN n=1 Tax=Luteimonas aquatica TaxID=450364 RepID=UPI001F580BD7|nr:general secretion pathway protein GspN [Luteimonas aquatica]